MIHLALPWSDQGGLRRYKHSNSNNVSSIHVTLRFIFLVLHWPMSQLKVQFNNTQQVATIKLGMDEVSMHIIRQNRVDLVWINHCLELILGGIRLDNFQSWKLPLLCLLKEKLKVNSYSNVINKWGTWIPLPWYSVSSFSSLSKASELSLGYQT